ncbi:MAG: DUF1232 domain-containing protein [Chloroflexi bacterium]|nr:DUF1232 domain-containing protein [Chloroflexota bacterium]
MLTAIRSAFARAYAAVRAFARRIKREIAVWRKVLKHPRTPRVSRWLLWFALVYAAMPFDLIPDFIPILGWLDDLVLVAIPIAIAIKFVPTGVIAECREAVGTTPSP